MADTITLARASGFKELKLMANSSDSYDMWSDLLGTNVHGGIFDSGGMSCVEYALISNNTAWLTKNAPQFAPYTYMDIYLSVHGDSHKSGPDGVYQVNGTTYYLKWTSAETFSYNGQSYQFRKISTSYEDWYDYENNRIDVEVEEPTAEDIEVQRKANIALVKSGISDKMQEFSNMLSKIAEKLNNHKSIYSTYIRFTIGDTVIVDTSSKTWDENCLVQLTHKQSGAGQANEFTLKILFTPNLKNYIAINQLENKLIQAMLITSGDSEIILKSETELHLDCEFVYGYGDDEEIRSEPYVGKVMGYSCDLNNGLLQYTISGVCGLYVDKEIRIEVKPEHYTDASGNEITNPLQFLQRFFEVEYGENSKTPGLYDIQFLDNIEGLETTYSGGGFANIGQKNLFQMVGDILNATMGNNEVNSTATNTSILPTNKTTFGYYVSSVKDSTDSNKAGTFYIYKIANEVEDASELKADANIQFNWFSPSPTVGYNHLVKKWSPEYNGLIAIAMAANITKNGNEYNSMDDEGNIVTRKSLGGARIGGSSDSKEQIANMMQEYSTWALQCQLPIEAKMVIQGCPYDVPMTGKIRVSAMMGHDDTLEHLSSGVYTCLGKTDIIGTSGFESELELFKPPVKQYEPPAGEALDTEYTNAGSVFEIDVATLASGKYQKVDMTDWSTEEIINITTLVGNATAAKSNNEYGSVEDYLSLKELEDTHVSVGILLDTDTMQYVSAYISKESLSTDNQTENNINIINTVIEDYNIVL